MDREPEGGTAEADDSSLSVTGTLDSGGHGRRGRRGHIVALAAAALLAGGLLAHGLTGPGDRNRQAAPTSGPGAPTPAITGPRGLQFDSATGTATLVLESVARVPGLPPSTALVLDLRLAVLRGVQVLTTDTFTTADPDGKAPIRASGVTVIEPGPAVERSERGFRFNSPASVEVRVVLDVPPGDHVVSVLGESAGQVLGTFTVRG